MCYFHEMENGKPFLVYRSSAGSGKTRSLAKEYLKLALHYRSDYFRHILAVTFTNKATQEMKDRILAYLEAFSRGESDSLATEIKQELNLDDRTFQDRSQETLSLILHNYSHFSISTIDAFFQRIIRSFTRESGLMGNFRLEVDSDLILEEIVKRIIDELGHKPELTEWVVSFSKERLKDGGNWNITYALVAFAREVLKEDFKQIEESIIHRTNDLSISDVHERLVSKLLALRKDLATPAQHAVKILQQHAVVVDDVKYGNQGTVWKFFQEWANGYGNSNPGPRITGGVNGIDHWINKTSPRHKALSGQPGQQLTALLTEMVDYLNEHGRVLTSIEMVLDNFYVFGLINDIVSHLSEYKSENNIMLLADASKFLNGIIGNSDTPFIYEKAGSYYNHFLIDEFQDTSGLQWKNFRPLLMNSLDQNAMSMVVGDVKQSIYRWRGSDLTLLQHSVMEEVGKDRTEERKLQSNFRSASNVVNFNNLLFAQAAHRISEISGETQARSAYHDVDQKVERTSANGFVRCHFFDDWHETGEEKALDFIVRYVEQWQELGARAGDIAILVRRNDEGQRVANHLLTYKNTKAAKASIVYDVVSSDSLRLDASASVSQLLAAFRFIVNPNDLVALGEFLIGRNIYGGQTVDAEQLLSNNLSGDNPLTEDVIKQLASQPIEEITEALIQLLGLGNDLTETAYLQAFQDVVLEFSAFEKNDLSSFLEWWEVNKAKKSIQSSSQVNAINIITIHKAKGLQFKYVMVPFCDWNLNHEGMKTPILWCRSDETPFNDLGYLALKYKSDMKASVFADDYKREFEKILLDNLNLLYVAFTRAEEGLLIMGPSNKSGKDPSSVGQLVCECIQYENNLAQSYTASEFRLGEMHRVAAHQMASIPEVELSHYPTCNWQEKLVIRTRGTEFFDLEKSAKRVKINLGILLHQILSRIIYKPDFEEVISNFQKEGIITDGEAESVKQIIQGMWSLPQLANWFSKEWTVKTEAPVLVPGKSPGRIDRVMFKENAQGKRKAVIIDYKSGEKKHDDKEQVQQYSLLLSQMGYHDVEAYLIYLQPLEIVPVVSKMNLNLF